MYGKEFAFFLQVCKDGSIRKAAKSLYISPQGLGKAIIALEHDLDIQLFERGKYGIRLTKYGEAIKPFAEQIVENVEAISQTITKLNKEVSGTLNIACSLGVTGALNPSLFSDFQAMFPGITFNIIEGSDLKVQNMVASMDDFIGITVGPCLREGLDQVFLCSHYLVWLINTTNPLSAKKKIEFSDLKDEPLIMYSEEFAAYHSVASCLAKEGITPNIVCYINEAIMAYKFCKKYKAIAITVDFIAEDVVMDKIVIKPILDERCLWSLYLISKSEETPSDIQQTFINYLLKATSSLRAK